jgi:tetratricopeptide (TPR) repeat protein
MRNGLKDCTDKKSIALVNSVLFDYYSSEFQNKPNKNIFVELMYYAGRTKNPAEFSAWLTESDTISYLVSCQIKGEQELIFQVTEDLINQYGSKNLALILINIYIDALHLGGDYQAAVATSKAYLDQYSLEEITSNESLCRMLIRKVHHSMFYLPVDGLIDEIQHILSGHYVDNYPTQKNEILFLLGGNLGVLSGKFSYAKDILNNALCYANETQNTNNLLRITRKLADIETYEGKCKDAVERIEQYITADSCIDKRYDVYLLASLGEAYRKSGNLEIARKCFEKVLKASREKNIPGWIAHAELAMAMIDYDLKCYSKVIESTMLVEKAYASINHEWGIINSQTLNMIANYKANGFT